MADRLNNIRTAYASLRDRVTGAFRTQIGDAPRLRIIRSEVLSLRAAATQV